MFFSPLPPQLHDLLRGCALRVFGGEIDSDTATDSFCETAGSDPHRWLTPPDDYTPVPYMWARAVGRQEGRAARCTCWFTAPMWDVGGYLLTSVPSVVAALKILRGENQERGVMAAETAFEPLPFFDQVASLLPDLLPNGELTGEAFEWLA